MADYISRKAAVKIAQKYGLANGSALGRHTGLADCIAIEIEGLPAADVEPVRRWIPCSERPPEELEPVNVVWVNHNPEPYYQEMKDVPQKATAVYYRKKWYWWSCVCEDLLAECGRNEPDLVDSKIEITHWMPLPEPPEEER